MNSDHSFSNYIYSSKLVNLNALFTVINCTETGSVINCCHCNAPMVVCWSSYTMEMLWLMMMMMMTMTIGLTESETDQSGFRWKVRASRWQSDELHEFRMRNEAKALLRVMSTIELNEWARDAVTVQLLQQQIHQWCVRRPNYTIC